ncbi:hypothetical protein VNI00_008259 [Paramarasmius palmivorus]|uniref:Methyltransferase domain-containing protein n=1 Tax=Paramarasmius palmivorus TaxID=297713 RepID=A0AAW0CYI2_9AGAR
MHHSHQHPHNHNHHGHGHGHGDHAALNKAHFDSHAESYDDTPGAIELTRKIGEGVLESISFDKEKTTVLDFACGTGLVSNVLVPHSKYLVGVDISEGMINQFTKRFDSQGLSSDKVKGVAIELKGEPGELDGAKFDVITCSMAFHHFDPSKLQDMTKILASFLKPGGYLFIMDMEPTNAQPPTIPEDWDQTIGHKGGFPESTMRSLFEGAGLTESFSYRHLTTFKMWDNEMDIFISKAQKPEGSTALSL